MENINKILQISKNIARILERKIIEKKHTPKWQNYLASDYTQFAVFGDESNNFLLLEDKYGSYFKKEKKEYYRKVYVVLRPFRRWLATDNGEYELEFETTTNSKASYFVKGWHNSGALSSRVSFINPQFIEESELLKDIKIFENILEFIKNVEIN